MEVIIYVGLIGLVMSGFVYFALSLTNIRNKALSVSQVTANARQIMWQVGLLARQADSIDLANSQLNSEASSLHLLLPTASANPTIIELSDNRLRLSQAGEDSWLSAADLLVDSCRVETDGQTWLKLSLSLRRPSSDQSLAYSQTYQTIINLNF